MKKSYALLAKPSSVLGHSGSAMLILLPPIAAEAARERNNLCSGVGRFLAADADGTVDAIDGFLVNFARHELFAQFQLLFLLSFYRTGVPHPSSPLSASEDIWFKSSGRNRPGMSYLLGSIRGWLTAGPSSVLRAFGCTNCSLFQRRYRSSSDYLRGLASSRALENMSRSRPSGLLTRCCRCPLRRSYAAGCLRSGMRDPDPCRALLGLLPRRGAHRAAA